MKKPLKNQKAILDKLGIVDLNPMQKEAEHAIHSSNEVVILSPTGTGKTLAFLIPIIAAIDIKICEVQVLIIAPSRELAIQIHQVVKNIGSGYKSNVVYGGRNFSKDRSDLKTPPALLIGTPGRLADHIRRETLDFSFVHTLVLDEFDKSLEIGFEDEMKEIVLSLESVKKKILTSATDAVTLPDFVEIEQPNVLNYLQERKSKLVMKMVVSPEKDKLKTLEQLLHHLKDQSGIVFCNFKDSINRISNYLEQEDISHGCFYGGLDQFDRERALVKFRNGTHNIIIATDLAARGLDIPEIDFIIHYHLPLKKEEFIHRNGRTARMNSAGLAYVLRWEGEDLPDFMPQLEEEYINLDSKREKSKWRTLFISGGRKDKISKGDIAGMLLKKGQIDKTELGLIELSQDCAFAAVASHKIEQLISLTDGQRIKKKKVRTRAI